MWQFVIPLHPQYKFTQNWEDIYWGSWFLLAHIVYVRVPVEEVAVLANSVQVLHHSEGRRRAHTAPGTRLTLYPLNKNTVLANFSIVVAG